MKPILFNTEMVKAILDGRKTVTRRVVKPQHLAVLDSPYHKKHPAIPDALLIEKLCKAPYQLGDILYVRETWAKLSDWTDIDPELGMPETYLYRAEWEDGAEHPRWHPSIHMPREAARIFLRVTDVRVECLREIQERGPMSAKAEGFVNDIFLNAETGASATKHFANFWNSTIKKTDLDRYGWDANPWVWAIEFRRCEKQEGA